MVVYYICFLKSKNESLVHSAHVLTVWHFIQLSWGGIQYFPEEAEVLLAIDIQPMYVQELYR